MKVLVSMCLLGVNCRYNGIPKEDERVKDLLSRKDITLIPVCPEQLGGLPTPRTPSERKGETVVSVEGENRTAAFTRGAEETLRIAKLYGCEITLLKERSPSCGKKEIYDGSFTGTVVTGEGVTTELLRRKGVKVFGESELAEFFEYVRRR